MSLSASSLLRVWERGLPQPPVERGLLLLAAACPDEERDELARLPIGRRDARLLSLREEAFGPKLECVVDCPACGEPLELSFPIADVRTPQGEETPEPLTVRSNGYEIRFRLPNSEDAIDLAGCPDEMHGRRLLVARCLVEVRRNDEPLAADQLPEDLVTAMAEGMARADPQANVELDLTCPVCQHRWQSRFDVVSYLWTETDAWARRTLGEVHALASAYGWSEAEILALSARRRQLYLDLIGR